MEPVEITVICTDPEKGKYLAYGGSPRQKVTADDEEHAVLRLVLDLGLIHIDRLDDQPVPAATAATAATAAPSEGMTWAQAENAMREGKKVARPAAPDWYLSHDPAMSPYWKLRIPPGAEGADSPERFVTWPQKSPKYCDKTRGMMAATDWKVIP
jgi:hypothetical protein